MIGGVPVNLPWPPLSASEIASAKDTAKDWQLNENHVPIMGDFHDLVCLDYSQLSEPETIIIDDDRKEIARFSSLKQFLNSLVVLERKSQSKKRIVEEESWIDF